METPRSADGMDETDVTPESYETDSGVIADIGDVEVDIVPSGEGEIVSSQADAETYGVELDETIEVPELPEDEA
jgi:hypothetical protein